MHLPRALIILRERQQTRQAFARLEKVHFWPPQLRKQTMTNQAPPLPASEFAEFGQRLIELGMAMKREQTTVRDLQDLAKACGIKLLNLRSVSKPELNND